MTHAVTKVLKTGGFFKIPFDSPSSSDQKIRLYHLQELAQETIQKAKAALQEVLQNQHSYQGRLEDFEKEIRGKPYLLQEGKTFRLVDEKEIQTFKEPLLHHIQVTQKAIYKFLDQVKVGNNLNITGKHAKVFFIQNKAHTLGRLTLGETRESLERYYHEQQTYIKGTLSSEGEKSIKIEQFVPVSLVKEKTGEEGKPSDKSTEEVKENDRISSQNLIQLTKDNQLLSIIVLGNPGSGKSTLSQYCGWQWWSSQGVWRSNFDLVFVLDLGKLPTLISGQQKSLEELLFEVFFKHQNASPVKSSEQLETLLKDIPPHRVLFLLDGYDEFPTNSPYQNVIEQRFLNHQRFYNVILTSRSSKRPSQARFDAVLQCRGLTTENILPYLQLFNSQKAEEIWKYIQTQPVLLNLAHTPLLLKMIEETWEKLPKNKTSSLTRTELYEAMRSQMWEVFAYKRRKNNPNIPELAQKKRQQIERFTAEVAFRALESGSVLFGQILLEYTLKHCNLVDLASLLEPSFIVSRPLDHQFYFPHLTLQEYWAAVYLVQALVQNQKIIQHDKDNNPQWITVHDFIALHKYNPRFLVVFEFMAGLLGEQARTSESHEGNSLPLQQFFNDLFSEPHDLAMGYELRLLARCFEECQNPFVVKQYGSFIQQLENYLKPENRNLIFALLKRNPGLLKHMSVLQFFEEQLININTMQQEETLRLISRVVSDQQVFPEKITHKLIEILKSQQVDSKDRGKIAEILEEVAKSGQTFPRETVKEKLLACLRDPQANYDDRVQAAIALVEVMKSGQVQSQEIVKWLFVLIKEKYWTRFGVALALAEVSKNIGQVQSIEVVKQLLVLLKNLWEDSDVRVRAARALVEVSKNVQALPRETMEDVLALLKDRQADSKVRVHIAEALVEVSKNGKTLPREAVEELFALLKDRQANSYVRSEATKALVEVSKSRQALPREVVEGFFAFLKDSQVDYGDRSNVAKILVEVSKNGQALPREVEEELFVFLKDQQKGYRDRGDVAKALVEVAKSEQAQFQGAMEKLLALLKDPQAHSDSRNGAAKALVEVIKSGQTLPRGAVEVFLELLKDPQTDSYIRVQSTEVLIEVAKREQSQEVIEVFRRLLRHSSNYNVPVLAAEALVEIAQSVQALPQEMIKKLFELLRNSKVESRFRIRAAKVLVEVSYLRQAESRKVEEVLLARVKDSQAVSSVRIQAAKDLVEIAQSMQAMLREMVEVFRELLKDLYASSDSDVLRIQTAKALVVVAKSKLAQSTVEELVALLRNPREDSDVRTQIGEVIVEVSKNEQAIPLDVVEEILTLLQKSFIVDPRKRAQAAIILVEVVQSVQTLPRKVVDMFFAFLRNEDIEFRGRAAEALGEIAKNGQALPPELLNMICDDPKLQWYIRLFTSFADSCCKFPHPYEPELLKKIFFLAGQAFYFYKGAFYVSGMKSL